MEEGVIAIALAELVEWNDKEVSSLDPFQHCPRLIILPLIFPEHGSTERGRQEGKGSCVEKEALNFFRLGHQYFLGEVVEERALATRKTFQDASRWLVSQGHAHKIEASNPAFC